MYKWISLFILGAGQFRALPSGDCSGPTVHGRSQPGQESQNVWGPEDQRHAQCFKYCAWVRDRWTIALNIEYSIYEFIHSKKIFILLVARLRTTQFLMCAWRTLSRQICSLVWRGSVFLLVRQHSSCVIVQVCYWLFLMWCMDASCDLSKSIDNAKRQSTLDEWKAEQTEGQTQSLWFSHSLTTSLCCPQEGAVLYRRALQTKPIEINTINTTKLQIQKTWRGSV